MIEVYNVIPLKKGSLLAVCSVYIQPWDMEIHDIKIFEKGTNRWLGMPSKDFVTPDGVTKYKDQMNFRQEVNKIKFRNQIMGAIDKWLAENPDMPMDNLIKENAELPF